jgi:hypothetical protein
MKNSPPQPKEQMWTLFTEPIIATLTAIFVVLSIATTVIVFLYPLEIETRESAVWLHVLTLKAGISLYDHSQVAFVEMQKGPFDALLKLAVSQVFPFLESWHVIRFAVLILPYCFFAIAWKSIEKKTSNKLVKTLFLGSVGYLILLISSKEFLFVGRPDATVALLFLILVYISLKQLPDKPFNVIVHGLLCGGLTTVVVLTNWRILPTVLTLLLFQIWQYLGQKNRHKMLAYLVCYGIASSFIFVVILGWLFDFKWELFWLHHAGFFSDESGWGATGYGRGSLISFTLSLFNPHAAPERLKGGPLLIAITIFTLAPKTRTSENRAWLLLLVFAFISNAIPYYMNYHGGGAWYFIPFLIILWFFLVARYSQINIKRLKILGIILMALLVLDYRTVILPTVMRVTSMHQARDFLMMVRSLQEEHTILSEDTFLFRTSYQGDLIDSGDEVSAIYHTGFLGITFDQTVERHFDELRKNPPNYIVTGFTYSPELEEVIDKQYTLVSEGPNNFTANGREASKLFQYNVNHLGENP